MAVTAALSDRAQLLRPVADAPALVPAEQGQHPDPRAGGEHREQQRGTLGALQGLQAGTHDEQRDHGVGHDEAVDEGAGPLRTTCLGEDLDLRGLHPRRRVDAERRQVGGPGQPVLGGRLAPLDLAVSGGQVDHERWCGRVDAVDLVPRPVLRLRGGPVEPGAGRHDDLLVVGHGIDVCAHQDPLGCSSVLAGRVPP